MTLRTLHVQHYDQIELVRLIRNECAAGFSNYTDQISEAEQIAWWEREKPLAWLYARPDGIVVGFGMLRQDAGRWVTVVAVLPEHGGQGYGKEITHDLVMRSPGQCWATARKDNPAAVRLHQESDWERIDGPDPRLVYFRTRSQEPRDFTFAMQPSLRPSFAAESGPDCRVEWRRQDDGRTVRVVAWNRRPMAVGGPTRSEPVYLAGERRPELFMPAQVGIVFPKENAWLDPVTGRELSR